jgi:hypothetical protein
VIVTKVDMFGLENRRRNQANACTFLSYFRAFAIVFLSN